MKLKEVIRLASDNDTVHGFRQYHESESRTQKSLWGGYLLGAVALFVCVVLPVTSKYARNERLVEVSLQVPYTFPTLSICPDTVLSPTGYCRRYKSPKSSSAISAVRARFMYNAVTINNRGLFEESGGLRIAVGHERDPVVLPGAGTFASNVRVSARWLRTEVVNPARRDCSSTHHSLEHCYADCIANVPCDGNCQLFSPFRNQTFGILCKGRDVALCLRMSLKMSSCIHACKKPCIQTLYTIANIAENPRSENYPIIDMVVESPDASLSMYEVPFSTASVYFAYVCNGLGVFLGVDLYALVGLAQLCSGTKLTRRIPPKIARLLPHLLLIFVSVPFLVSLTKDYFVEEKTAARSSIDRQNISTTLMIAGPSISEQKLKNLLNLGQDFWDEDDDLRESQPELPTMCDLVSATMWGDPTTYQFEVSNDNVRRRVAELSAILANSDYVKKYGIRNLILNSTEDPSDIFVNVTSEAGEAVKYTSEAVVTASLIAFAITIDNTRSSTFLQGNGNQFRINTYRSSKVEHKCRAIYKDRGLIATEEGETVFIFNFLIYTRVADLTVKILPVRSTLKDSRKRRCSKNGEEYNRCITICYQTVLPCECENDRV